MVDFRRWITAIAGLALFTGLASAQVTIGSSTGAPAGPLTCTATVAVPPQLRSEGLTELIGDIVIQCTGGNYIAPGGAIPTANITVSLGTNVTSRLLGTSGISNASEALLLIDEPNASASTASGPGPAMSQTVCSTPSLGAGAGGCTEVAGTVAGGTAYGSCATLAAGGGCATPAANVFQGLVSANQVIFNGVPINPPVTGGFARVFRITNIRANVAALGSSGFAGTTPLNASISISGSTSLPISNPVQIAGFIQSGLTTAVRKADNSDTLSAPALSQCASADRTAVATLRFRENFGTAFKTRVAPTGAYSGQSGVGVLQNVPGNIYNSESGFVTTGVTGNGNTAGLADYGTRLKATFNNVPSGVRIFVSTTNINNASSTGAPVANPNTSTVFTSTTSFAQLVVNETTPDANGVAPTVSSTTSTNSGAQPLAEIPIVNGSGTAVWEVINTNPNASEDFNFGVWTTFTANPGSNSPAPGTTTINMSFAPTPPAFSASSGGSASSSLPIPRFVDSSTPANLFSVAVCNTVLLYPFVTNQGGFDTGIAIANTSTDPFGTKTQSGTCTLNWYGDSAPGAITTPVVQTGTDYAFLTSTSAPGFQGYMIAVCNFQLAHGFAFISDLGARNLAMGYLAIVLPTGTGDRNSGHLGGTAPTSVEVWAH